MTEPSSEYRPGACNIGAPQRRRRAMRAVAAFVVAAAIVVAYHAGYVPNKALLASVFVPLALGCEWAIQAYDAFCVRLALLGRYDFRADGGGTEGRVSDPGARRQDTVRAAKITVLSLLLAALVTTCLVLFS